MDSPNKAFEPRRASNDFSDSACETNNAQTNSVQTQTNSVQTVREQPVQTAAREIERYVVPVVGEEITVDKRVVEAGKVRIAKRVREEAQTVDVPVYRETVEVERIAFNQFVDQPPGIRYEGETMIIPVLREELVVEKRLVLVEELRVTKRQIETVSPQQVTLLREEVQVERDASGNTGFNQ